MSEAAVKEGKPIGKAAMIDVAKMDELKQLGWRTEKLGSGWSAYEINGDRRIGPARSLAALHTAVLLETGNKFELPAVVNDVDAAAGDVELEENSKGERYLPGTAPIVNQELAAAIGKYHAIKTDRVGLTNKEKEAKDELIALCHIHEKLFVPDPDNDDAKIYRAGDLVVRVSVKKTEEVKTEIATSED